MLSGDIPCFATPLQEERSPPPLIFIMEGGSVFDTPANITYFLIKSRFILNYSKETFVYFDITKKI